MTEQSGENLYVVNPEDGAEMARLTDQDLLMTRHMGGLLPPWTDYTRLHDVLDIACGPGGWALSLAFEHPEIHVVGLDISNIMIQYARAHAHVRKLNNVTFLVGDATKQLPFADESFDLVNARFLAGFMSPEHWPSLLAECRRITRPGGFIRLTECDDLGHTSSPAFERLWLKVAEALQRTGRSHTPVTRDVGITHKLSSFLKEAGYSNLRRMAYAIDYSSGEEAHDGICQDWMVGLKLLQPFLVKAGVATAEEVSALYDQAMQELREEHFCGLLYVYSVWAELTPAAS
jgi:SAM-dependent methyltransferase